MSMTAREKLLVCCKQNPRADVVMYCFPFSGAGPAFFRRWCTAFADLAEFHAVQLPGREGRFAEPMNQPLARLVDDIAARIVQTADRPYAFFGHSLGVHLAWCTLLRIRQLVAQSNAMAGMPRALFLSARQAPDAVRNESLVSLSDTQLLARLRELGGIPAAMQNETELLQMSLPKIRYDLGLNETMVPGDLHAAQDGVDVPLYIYEGTHDRHTQNHDLARWKNFTRSEFHLRRHHGDHFFIADTNSQFAMQFKNDLQNAFSRAARVASA